MFSYKGVDNDYNYKVGTVEAINQADAINKIKENENILIIVSLNKRSNNKMVNNIQSNFIKKYVDFENKMKNKKKKKKEKAIEKDGIEKTLTEKSPILKMIKNISNNLPKRKVVIDEQAYNDIQMMFKTDVSNDISSSYSTDELTENKISMNPKKKKEDNNGRAINWELLNDENADPVLNKNKKIKVKAKEILMFTRRLHIMLSSGVSLLSSLTLLSETSSKNMTIVLNGILEDIKMGSSFSESIAKYPKQFNSAYVSLISIGETSGELDECIADIIKMKEQEQKVVKKVKNASIYPGIIGGVLAVMMAAASLFFLPKFNEMFEEQDLAVPQFTKIVFGIAEFVPYILVITVVLVVSIAILKRRIPLVNQAYVGIKDKLLLKIPVVKEVTNALYMYYFSSTISLMLKNGIRLSDTLTLAGRSINNIYVRNEIENVGQLMTHGFSFSEAMRKQEHFDDILINITLTGEESGKMIYSLAKVSDYYNTELNNRVDAMMEIVPSMSIILIGVIAAPVIIAAYLPILEISSGAGLGL